MLQCTMIGNLGANAEIKAADGREFVTFRIAHNESFTGADGTKTEKSMWVDCTMSCTNGRPAVLPYLKKGTAVCVVGNISTRVYSSEKDRCLKAGITIHVMKLELIGGQSDSVPSRVYDGDGAEHLVVKFFFTDLKDQTVYDRSGHAYSVDKKGWVTPVNTNDNGEQQR